jgi:hypothetical protein
LVAWPGMARRSRHRLNAPDGEVKGSDPELLLEEHRVPQDTDPDTGLEAITESTTVPETSVAETRQIDEVSSTQNELDALSRQIEMTLSESSRDETDPISTDVPTEPARTEESTEAASAEEELEAPEETESPGPESLEPGEAGAPVSDDVIITSRRSRRKLFGR